MLRNKCGGSAHRNKDDESLCRRFLKGKNNIIRKRKLELFQICQPSSVETKDQFDRMSEQKAHQLEKQCKNVAGKSAVSENNCESSSYDEFWKLRFEELKEYKRKHGHCNVRRSYPQLGHWVHSQRNTYSYDKLSQERINALNKIGFLWRMKYSVEEVSVIFFSIFKNV